MVAVVTMVILGMGCCTNDLVKMPYVLEQLLLQQCLGFSMAGRRNKLSIPPLPLLILHLLPTRPCCGPSRYEMKVLGYNLMQAMRFAVEEINNHSSLLPGVLLGYEMVDICYISNSIQPVLYFLAREDSFLPIQDDYSNYVPRVVAVIGPDNTESTGMAAHLLSLLLLPQVRS